MGIPQSYRDERETDQAALRDYIEHSIQCEIDELASLADSYDAMWRLHDYLWDRLPFRRRPAVTAVCPQIEAEACK